VKIAVTDWALDMLMVQVPVPEHAPVQPVNLEVPDCDAVSVTLCPAAYLAEHVLPQLIPDGALVTVPEPVPAFTTVSL
jgi:hypothetical protein